MEPKDPARERPERHPEIGDFLVEPTRDLEAWRWLWAGDHAFPIRSHRGFLGQLIVLFKRLFRPLLRTPLADLFERQQVFNLVLLERLQEIERTLAHLRQRVDVEFDELRARQRQGMHDLTLHHDALFALLDQKLDRHRRSTAALQNSLGAALAVAGTGRTAALAESVDEAEYLALEDRYRGSEAEIAARLERYLPYLQGKGEVLDLGCGRGEFLALLGGHGIRARGIDGSSVMVAACRERGLKVEQADLFAALAGAGEASLGGIVSFHVIEHLPAESLDRLVRLAWRALRPGGVLILETPSPLSLVVGARNFWLDPTHRRPVHPDSLRLACEQAGFTAVERLDLQPFAPSAHLPELALNDVPPEQRDLADRVNRLRDALDDLLYGYQDFAIVATKSPAA